jgi:hypothetical protein
MQGEHVVSHNIITSHMMSNKTTIAIAFSQNAMITSFLYAIHASSHTKCNIHAISSWAPSVTHVSGEFHVKMVLLALLAHHLLTWS